MPNWRPYVSVAQRRVMARRELGALRRQGKSIHPIEIEGRTIARSFWGDGWCKHLESFSDYDNRLPRGRTYVRNGSVCHLDIQRGRVEAIVRGSMMYDVNVSIKPLRPVTWRAVKKKCSGRIGSMLELLQGRLSDQVMAVVTEAKTGLFPRPGEIEYRCDCPDWATMCKHVAAVMYGIGHRLDDRPELLFVLRGVDAEELISTDISLPGGTGTATGEIIADHDLSDIFGIDVEERVDDAVDPVVEARSGQRRATTTRGNESKSKSKPTKRKTKTKTKAKTKAKSKTKRPVAAQPKKATTSGRKTARTAVASKRPSPQDKKPPRIRPTGKSVVRLRKLLGLSVAQLADALGVSTATVYRWQATTGRLNMRANTLDLLARLHERSQERVREG